MSAAGTAVEGELVQECAWCKPPAPQKEGEQPVSHGICRQHELEQYEKLGAITDEEWQELLSMRVVLSSSTVRGFLVKVFLAAAALYFLIHVAVWWQLGFRVVG